MIHCIQKYIYMYMSLFLYFFELVLVFPLPSPTSHLFFWICCLHWSLNICCLCSRRSHITLHPFCFLLLSSLLKRKFQINFYLGGGKSPNVWRDENNVDTFLFMFHWIGLHCTRASRKNLQSTTIINNSSFSLSRTLFIRTNGYAYFLVLATVTAGTLWPISWAWDDNALGRKGKILQFKSKNLLNFRISWLGSAVLLSHSRPILNDIFPRHSQPLESSPPS